MGTWRVEFSILIHDRYTMPHERPQFFKKLCILLAKIIHRKTHALNPKKKTCLGWIGVCKYELFYVRKHSFLACFLQDLLLITAINTTYSKTRKNLPKKFQKKTWHRGPSCLTEHLMIDNSDMNLMDASTMYVWFIRKTWLFAWILVAKTAIKKPFFHYILFGHGNFNDDVLRTVTSNTEKKRD